MSPTVISVENISKAYLIGLQEQIPDSLTTAIGSFLKAPFRNLKQLRRLNTYHNNHDADDIYWALKNISFEVKEGEVLGVIGRNGAGKSTLLKVLSRVTEPTSGRAIIHGRVSSLLEVGTGFHPDLSGRENVYLNGTILGMTKREIDRKFDEIVDFSGVEKFLDTPIKRYSSGMKVRLAFAVAAHLEPEILIIDEVLAVGDAEFQRKCLGKMQSVASSGRTVLFVSHNMAVVRGLCSTSIVLDGGKLIFSGSAREGCQIYTGMFTPSETAACDLIDHPSRVPGKQCILTGVRITNEQGLETTKIECGESIQIQFSFNPCDSHLIPDIAVLIEDANGQLIATIGTFIADFERRRERTGLTASLTCTTDNIPLCPGNYYLSFRAGHPANNCTDDELLRTISIEVTVSHYYGSGKLPNSDRGPLLLRSTWT